jgi:hypothetical protein
VLYNILHFCLNLLKRIVSNRLDFNFPPQSTTLRSHSYSKQRTILLRFCSYFGIKPTAVTNRPIVPTPGDYDDGETGGMMIGRGNRSTRRKPAPVPLCPPQTPHARPAREPGPPRYQALGPRVMGSRLDDQSFFFFNVFFSHFVQIYLESES